VNQVLPEVEDRKLVIPSEVVSKVAFRVQAGKEAITVPSKMGVNMARPSVDIVVSPPFRVVWSATRPA
jgi:hypothetical protein